MRVTKQKRHRKVVRFYSACFGFREPFKVLCDGTFIHHLLLHRLTPANDAISRLLGARALLFTTSCIIAELKSLGESHSEALQAAGQLVTARCDHNRRVSATACIEAVLREANTEHFFLATQDTDLRKKYQEVPGVPVIYGLKNSLFLDQPSTHQREYAKVTEEKRLHMSYSEYQKLHNRESKDGPEKHATDLPPEHDGSRNEVVTRQAIRNTFPARQKLDVTDKSKFKRKKTKGPNPLSCKKKKKGNSPVTQNQGPNPLSCKKKKKGNSPVTQNQSGEIGADSKRKRNRKRKRAHKDSKLEELGS